MAVAVVTGSGGLVGSECVKHFAAAGYDVVGVENDMRASFFGPTASTRRMTSMLLGTQPGFSSVDLDVRDNDGIDGLFAKHGSAIEVVIHTAAQPSHDWAAKQQHTDF